MLDNILDALDFTPEESRTYLALLESGPGPAGKLAQRIGVKRPSLYGFLARLVERGAAVQSLKDGIKIFAAEPPEKLLQGFQDKISELETQRTNLQNLLPALKEMCGDYLQPRFEFFEGCEGVRNVLQDMLLYSGIETRSYWPMQEMIDILGPDFFDRHNRIRIGNKVRVKAIWPESQVIKIKDHPYLRAGKEFYREIRIAPPEIRFSMGYWIYKNKVAFLSSKRECFGFIVESTELTEMMVSQHEMIWRSSNKLDVRAHDVANFIRELKKQ